MLPVLFFALTKSLFSYQNVSFGYMSSQIGPHCLLVWALIFLALLNFYRLRRLKCVAYWKQFRCRYRLVFLARFPDIFGPNPTVFPLYARNAGHIYCC